MRKMSLSTSFDAVSLTCVPCGHRFCAKCIFKWFQSKANKCPTCRETVHHLMRDPTFDDLCDRLCPPLTSDDVLAKVDDNMTCRTIDLYGSEYGIVLQDTTDIPGAFIKHIETDGVAYAAGLRAGDFILGMDDRPFFNLTDGVRHLRRCIASGRVCRLICKDRKESAQSSVRGDFESIEMHGVVCLKAKAKCGKLHTGDLMISIDDVTGALMIRYMLRHGATVDGKRLFCSKHDDCEHAFLYLPRE